MRRFIVIDEHHVVALAPPIALVLNDALRDSDIMTRAFGLKHHVVGVAVLVLGAVNFWIAVGFPIVSPALIWLCLTIFGVEVLQVVRQ